MHICASQFSKFPGGECPRTPQFPEGKPLPWSLRDHKFWGLRIPRPPPPPPWLKSWILHCSGFSFAFQARCTGSTRTNKRRRFQKSSVIDRLNDAWKRGMDQEETSTTSIDRRAGEWVHGRSSEPLLSCSLRSSVWFSLFLCWWTWGVSSRSFTTEEVDSSSRLLLKQTTSPGCRSGECIHNQLVSISLAVLYFNLHFRCLALMHWENNQSSVTAEADGHQVDSAFWVTSGVTSQNVEGRTEPSLKVNCFYTDMMQLHLHWLNKIFMLYQCTVHGGLQFSVQGPEPLIFFWQWACGPVKVCFFFK